MQIDIKTAERQQTGSLTIHDFMVKDEPAMRRLATEAVRPSGSEVDAGLIQGQAALGPRASAAPALQIDPNSVAFTKLQVRFARNAGRTEISDGVMWGAQIGASVAGYVDFSRDRVDLSGAFVPAYQLNNLFAKIPLVGPILGGGTHEGLFAINYRVSGAASAPVLHVNPLSAIAPGFLRKIFGVIDGTAQPLAGVPAPALER